MPEHEHTISFDRKGQAGWIFFDRPERMNALAPQSLRELWALLGKIEADNQVRVAVFTGRGVAFCAGMDMAGMERISALAARRRSREMQMLTNRIAELSLPTIAAVNGVAMGAGLEVCLACDLVIATKAALFAFPEVKLGMIPCGGGTQRLARLVGLRRAREMILAGRILDPETALVWGLVNEVVEPGKLAQKVEEAVERLAQGGRFAAFQAKRCLNHSLDMDINRGLEYETECFTTCFSTREPASGLKRFAEGESEQTEKLAAKAEEPQVEAAKEEKETAAVSSRGAMDDPGIEQEEKEEAEEEEEDIWE